jgi:hypothetical protein
MFSEEVIMPVVTIKLTIGSFSTEVTGPPKYAEKKVDDFINRFLTSAKTAAAEPKPTTSPSKVGGKALSPAEFVKKISPRNKWDTALLLAYFLENTKKVASFTSAELTTLGREIKRPFTNPSDTVAKLTSRGLMMSAGEKDGKRAYALTASGEQYVEAMVEN